ncbi:MAG: o-succinylbenzoate synthase [Candidatus Eremiobacteraeota bacterium]|nr:o-succinylbenzoate synthase [Candidatus Eremiobacteraeota bacterium]MCW5866661.1 o-succinylbenzoate synthase [Candidatus Eremiobacteraeota bacterium]
MRLDRVELRWVSMPLRTPFETSFARETEKDCLLVRVFGEGFEGWGEVVAMKEPLYNEETLKSCWHILEDLLIPLVLSRAWETMEEWDEATRAIRRNYMARAGLEAALWDLYSLCQGQSLAALWGGVRQRVEVGISLGIEASLDRLLPQVEAGIGQGYRRVKLKIKPGWDLEVVRAVRSRWPDLVLQVDANSAYHLRDAEHLSRLDDFGLLLVEQPLEHDDIVDHAALQKRIKTPICLDESIDTTEQCRRALELGSAQIINIKPGRVGGYAAARAIHDLCASRAVPCWVGGMLETGVGRLQNLALASLENFKLPGDISASRRYFERDIIHPEVVLESDGCVRVPETPGTGQFLDWRALERSTVRLGHW